MGTNNRQNLYFTKDHLCEDNEFVGLSYRSSMLVYLLQNSCIPAKSYPIMDGDLMEAATWNLDFHKSLLLITV